MNRRIIIIAFLICLPVISGISIEPKFKLVAKVDGKDVKVPEPGLLTLDIATAGFNAKCGRLPSEKEKKELKELVYKLNESAIAIMINAKVEENVHDELFPILCPKEKLEEAYKKSFDRKQVEEKKQMLESKKAAFDYIDENPDKVEEAYTKYEISGSLKQWLRNAKSQEYRKSITEQLDEANRQLSGEIVITKYIKAKVYMDELAKYMRKEIAKQNPDVAKYLKSGEIDLNSEIEGQIYEQWVIKKIKEAKIEILDPQYNDITNLLMQGPFKYQQGYKMYEDYFKAKIQEDKEKTGASLAEPNPVKDK